VIPKRLALWKMLFEQFVVTIVFPWLLVGMHFWGDGGKGRHGSSMYLVMVESFCQTDLEKLV
jgi:hypothetical protein